MTENYPITERLPLGLLLAGTSGALDAYTYLAHGGVFAGMQTGNMILMGVSVGRGDWATAIARLIPFLVFAIGTVIVRSLQHYFAKPTAAIRRGIIVLGFETAMAFLTAILAPYISDIAASSMVAIIAAAQLQEFRRMHGKPFISIMMTGNLRTTAEGIFEGVLHHDHAALLAARDAGSAIVALIFGAVCSALTTHYLGDRGILFALIPLVLALIYVAGATPLAKLRK